MKVLGIDTGYAHLGFSVVIPGASRNKFHVKLSGSVQTPKGELDARVIAGFRRLLPVVRLEQPDAICIEDYTPPIAAGGAGVTNRGMNRVIGACLTLAEYFPKLRGIPIEVVPVSVWHKALGVQGTGRDGAVVKSDVARALRLYVDNLEHIAGWPADSHAVDATGLGVYEALWLALKAKERPLT